MGKHDGLAKTLAVFGVVLVGLPIVAPLVVGVLVAITRPAGAPVNFDYLMPFEIYPVTLVGMALIVWASLRARARRRAVGIAIGGMLGGVVGGGISAQATGIAQSVETLETWRYVLTSAFFVISVAAQLGLIVIGILLIKDLFSAGPIADTPAVPAH